MSSTFTRLLPARAAICSLALTCLLAGCGPKDIGAGTSGDAPATAQGVATEDQLRYPIMGSSRTQQLLYIQNRPDIMANTQQWRLQQFNRAHGLDREQNPEHPEYRAVPKQRSPFKQ
ncbi:chemotaxis protein [Desulfovibrio sp.]|uniref:chemotaxis protein n=1 Tax=Desulfovibrio sp. TaxID=885 RepID=UPI0025B9B4CE|nr:chemotaxis protein [Desulfovibrio sp.]